jgi:menaquinone-9 beta-reductase
MPYDAIVVGAGPAGAVAATVLARAGARVRLLDRACFPRHKLCGDTLNPAALADLKRLRLDADVCGAGLRLDGMKVTGEGGVSVDGRYPDGLSGRALPRLAIDQSFVAQAVAAGVDFTDNVRVQRAHVEYRGGRPVVIGIEIGSNGHRSRVTAPVTLAADGRHSTLAFALGLAAHPRQPRRWAIGAYASGVTGMSALGEMHIRRGRYIGLAPMPDGRTNVCLVKPFWSVARSMGDPAALLAQELRRDRWLADRVCGVRFDGPPTVLGPLAVNVAGPRQVPHGLLLAGDAAGFVDPMTGDGLRFAIRGGELAAIAALQVLAHGWDGVRDGLDRAHRLEFASKQRFNRVLRSLVASPMGVAAASLGARIAPGVIRMLMARASDCQLAAAQA